MLQIAVLGHGVVGSGVVEVLAKNGGAIEKKTGNKIEIKYILDKRDFPDSPYKEKFTKDFSRILQDSEIKVVVEVMGGISPAYEFTKSSLNAGKSVVTSNKELVAAKGAELLKVAEKNNVNFFFEASVGGGIPIISPIYQCLAANEIDEIAGILNGTTNYILTKMIKDGMAFEDALKLAQKLGYAEADPSADVEGHDACRKICILASLAFGSHVYPDKVHTEGIAGIALEDVLYAGNWGGVIKLIGRARRLDDGKIAIMVSPAFIGNGSQLASVDDVFNGILVRGDATGDVVFYGKGAGKLPTASAVVSDIIDAVKASGTVKALQWEDSKGGNVADYRFQSVAFYVRAEGDPGKIIAKAKALFGDVQVLGRVGRPGNEAAFVTPVLQEAQLEEKIGRLEAEAGQVLSKIRVLDY